MKLYAWLIIIFVVQFGIGNAKIEILTLIMIVGFGLVAVGIIHLVLNYIIWSVNNRLLVL